MSSHTQILKEHRRIYENPATIHELNGYTKIKKNTCKTRVTNKNSALSNNSQSIDMPKITKSFCESHNQSFRTFEELNKHIQQKHVNLWCSICNRVFNNEKSLQLHLKKNHTKH